MNNRISYIHGILLPKSVHKKLLNALHKEAYSVDFLNLPGHDNGFKASSAKNLSGEFFKACKQSLDKADVIIGHSTGAKIILDLIDHGLILRDKKIVLVDPAIYSGSFPYFNPLLRLLRDNARYISDYQKIPIPILTHILKNNLRLVPTINFLKDVDVEPAFIKLSEFDHIVLWGDKDLTTPYRWAAQVQKKYPAIKIKTLQGKSHGWVLEEPEFLLEVLDKLKS